MVKFQSLKKYIEAQGLTQKQIARKLGISESYLSMIVNGERQPSLSIAARISERTGVPIQSLLLEKSVA